MALLQAGCVRAPDSYPPPVQRSQTFARWELERPFVEMSAYDVQDFIVRDISPVLEGGTWRWTFERPELRFILNSTEGLRFAADVGAAAATLAETGPLTISFLVNDRLLGQMRCDTPGERHFEKPVPAAWLNKATYTRVVIHADKLFIAKADGAKLGFVLHRAGFLE